MVEEVRTLKVQQGLNIVIDSSNVLVHTLAEHDLIDEYSLFVYPVVLGCGKKLFPEGQRVNLHLIEARPLPSGVVLMRYARALGTSQVQQAERDSCKGMFLPFLNDC